MKHLPAMVGEMLYYLRPKPGGIYVDCTLGDGGHAISVLKASEPGGFLIGIDRDIEGIRSAEARLDIFKKRIKIFHGNYADIRKFVGESGCDDVDGILLDLGVSTRQLLRGDRGFSFRRDGMLDMRMDRDQRFSALDIVNNYPGNKLKKIIYQYGEERYAGRIASAIVREREGQLIQSTLRLAEVIRSAIPSPSYPYKVNSITRTFQAIRIAVNEELSFVERGIRESINILKPGGRICVISYHSLEDRIVKTVFKELEKGCVCPPKFPVCVCGEISKLRILTRKPVVPEQEEVVANPRVRSAKLRAAERVST